VVVTVTAEHAAGVRMDTGLGDVIELTPQPEPGVFVGEIAVLTGLINGPQVALLTPWKDAVDGATVGAPYEIALPAPGTGKKWETNDLIGPGQVVPAHARQEWVLGAVRRGGRAPRHDLCGRGPQDRRPRRAVRPL
jgi:hypothetical protein